MKLKILLILGLLLPNLAYAKDSNEGTNDSISAEDIVMSDSERVLAALPYPGRAHIMLGELNRGLLYMSLVGGSALAGIVLSVYGNSYADDFYAKGPRAQSSMDKANQYFAISNALLWGAGIAWGVSVIDIWLSPPRSSARSASDASKTGVFTPQPLQQESSNGTSQAAGEGQVAAPKSTPYYTLQTETFSEKRLAQEFALNLSRKIKPVWIIGSASAGEATFRVCVGKFKTKESAVDASNVYQKVSSGNATVIRAR